MNEKDSRVQLAKEVKSRVSADLRKYANVTGAGVGLKVVKGQRTGTVSIRVYVSKKLPKDQLREEDILPEQIEGVPVDVIEVVMKAHGGPIPLSTFTDRHNPMTGGISVGNPLLGSGTLSFNVFDNVSGEGMILSNWHVLCGRLDCAISEPITQPGDGGGDTGELPRDLVARLYREAITSEVDGALARLTGNRVLNREILGLGTVVEIGNPVLGMAVTKAGRTTGITSGVITDVSADITVQYDDAERTLVNQIFIEGTNVSLPGDSGSVWIDDQQQAIGLNFAGNDDGTMAAANQFSVVVSTLNFNLKSGITMQDFVSIANLELL